MKSKQKTLCLTWIIPFSIFLALMLPAFTGCKKKDEGNQEKAPVVVSALKVSTGPIENVLRFTGDIRARRDVRLLSQVGERIIALHADKGDRVEKGQIVAVVDSSLLSHGVAQAEAAVAAARANFTNIESEYGRASRLHAEQAISQQQYDARKMQKENATSALNQAEAALEQMRRQYQNAFIRAPFSGIISNRFVEVGDMVAPGTPVFGLVQIDTVRVWAQVSEREFTRIQPGLSARLKVASLPERVFFGSVTKKMPILDPVSRLASVEIFFDNPRRELVPGMFGDLEIVIGQKKDVPRIPVSSLLFDSSPEETGALSDEEVKKVAYVFVVEAGKAVRKNVTTGYRQNGWIEVVSGVAPGDTLVIRGQHLIEEGSAVKVAPAAQTAKQGDAL